ncbi:MAG: hypothetical protein KFF73_09950 [Cyclobacteriaceae bacterium]|nr:hypothetical protein [Cyclobacteriaceae bacterium]
MDYSQVKELLEKYWMCETTLEEEKMLSTYFQKDDLPRDFGKYRDLFRYFSAERKMELNGNFDERVLELVEKKQRSGRHRYLSMMYKVAAAVLLILSFFVIHERFIKVKDQARKVVEDTFDNPEKALEETKKVLYFVSEKLNRGKEEVSRLNKFKKAEEVVRNSKYKDI